MQATSLASTTKYPVEPSSSSNYGPLPGSLSQEQLTLIKEEFIKKNAEHDSQFKERIF